MKIVVFGDEVGIPIALRSLPPEVDPVIVCDPGRKSAVKFYRGLNDQFISLYHPDKKNRKTFMSTLAERNPILGVIASYSRIIWRDLLQLFPNGIVNLHNARLPFYRGCNTLQWTLINGEQTSAATLHYINDGIDTGPIIEERFVTVDDDDTAAHLQRKLNDAGETLLRKWLPRLIQNKIQASPQDDTKAVYWPKRHPEDGLIDWSWPNEKIRNLTRALVSPWPHAFYYSQAGRKISVTHVPSIDEIRELKQTLNK